MQLKRRIAALALTLSLLAAGCTPGAVTAPEQSGNGNTATGDVAMGRYVESQWSLPQGHQAAGNAHKMPDGRLGLLLYDEDYVYHYFSTTDGIDWREETPAWLEELHERGQGVSSIHYNSQGVGVVVHSGPTETSDYTYAASLLQPDGTLVPTGVGGDTGNFGGSNTKIYNFSSSEGVKEIELEGDEIPEDLLDRIGIQTDQPDDEDEEDPAEAVAEADVSAEITDGGEDDREEQTSGPTVMWSDESEYVFIEQARIADNGDIYAEVNFAGIKGYRADSWELVAEGPNRMSTYTLAGDQLVVAVYPDEMREPELTANSLVFYSLSDGSVNRTMEVDLLQNSESDTLYGDSDGSLYLAGQQGVYRLTKDGETWERIIDGTLSSLSMPSHTVSSIVPHGDNEFLVMMHSNSGWASQLFNYAYDPDVTSRPDTELTVYTLRENLTLQQAVSAHRKVNPNVVVNVEALLDDDSSATVDDAIRALNTELLAGKGPDLLILDGMPVESYIDKNVLADVTDVVQPLVDDGTLLGNLVGAFAQGGKLYAVPARVSVPSVWGDMDTIPHVGSLGSLADYAQSNKDLRTYFNLRTDSLLSLYAPVSQSAWLNTAGQVDVDTLAAFYTDLQRLAATDGGNGTAWPVDEEETYGFSRWVVNRNYEDFMMDSMFALSTGEVQLFTRTLSGFDSVMEPNGTVYTRYGGSIIDSDTEITTVPDDQVSRIFAPLGGQSSGVYLPGTIAGVNAASGQQELAKEFLATLLGEETQAASLGDGFAVNTKALETVIMRENNIVMFWSTTTEDGVDRELSMGWPSEAMLRAIAAMLENLDTPVILNETLLEMVADESEAFFSGSVTAAQAAENVAQRARLLLAQ